MNGYTTIEQSKKLLELGLSPETADMEWVNLQSDDGEDKYEIFVNSTVNHLGMSEDIPAWSLSALINILPPKLVNDATEYTLEIYKNPDKSYDVGYFYKLWAFMASNNEELIDACVEMIIRLNELKIL